MGNAVGTRAMGRPVRHGQSRGSATYRAWANMKRACDTPSSDRYKYAGAKGIRYCERWATFEHFMEDMGEKPDGATLQRRDRQKGYEPDNCFWQVK